jgi:hypothetical protein
MGVCNRCHVDFADAQCKSKPPLCYSCCVNVAPPAFTCREHFDQMPPDLQKQRRAEKRRARRARQRAASTNSTNAPTAPSSAAGGLSSVVSGFFATLSGLWGWLNPSAVAPVMSAKRVRRPRSETAKAASKESTPKKRRQSETLQGKEGTTKKRRTRVRADDSGMTDSEDKFLKKRKRSEERPTRAATPQSSASAKRRKAAES